MRLARTHLLALAILFSTPWAAHSAPPAPPPGAATPSEVEFFESRIRPVLVEHCYSCHGEKKQRGGLRLDTREALRKGGESGPLLALGQGPARAEDSLLLRAVRYKEADLRMPPDRALPPDKVGDLERWVRIGAPDPRTGAGTSAGGKDWPAVLRERRTWWSLQPVGRPEVPTVRDRGWPLDPLDHFIRARQEARGLQPAPPADLTTLARRASFVLLGLPPEPEQVAALLADGTPGAYERYVDGLLSSPHFGERWARHWMDVVRYGDTYGYEWDVPAKGAWLYRDYLVRAFNADVPFDQLVREQVAGDLLPSPRLDRRDGLNESLAGPMFFQLGEKRHGDSAMFNGIHQEMLHGKIDAFSRAFQGLTVGCAQCHDHKLDAVSQRDYYALAGVFMSGHWLTRTLDAPGRQQATLDGLRDLKRELRCRVAAWWLSRPVPASWRGLAAGPVPVEHPLHAWQALRGARDADLPARWNDLKTTYARLRAERRAGNARDYRVVADFRGAIPPGWSVDGVGFEGGPGKAGDFTVALSGPRIVGRVLPAGRFSDALSPRLNGAIRTPLLREFDRQRLSFHLAGGDFSAERLIVDNAFIAERQTYLTSTPPAWRTSSTNPEMKTRRVYLEYATKTSNPNFPPRVGLGGACSEEQAADPRSWLGVTRVVAHDVPGAPADELGRFETLFAGEAPRDQAALAARYEGWMRRSVEAWRDGRADDEQVILLGWMLDNKLLPNGEGSAAATAPPAVTEVLARYRALEAAVLTPRTINGMADAAPAEDYRLNARGDFDRPTSPVPRGYLEVLGAPRPAGSSSGRLELANHVASAENPLTSRVYVNRLWHWVFGTGLVATPDDFGRLGDSPSHPELLDRLAADFVRDGWSTRRLLRRLVTSAAFRQSGRADPAAIQADPTNRLVHHYPLRRLEAEAIRDAILATSGRLDRRLGGPAILPHRAHEDREKRLFSGPLDGAGRRSLYTSVSIMAPPAFLTAFNQPPAKIPTGRRDVTSVPAQALTLLNDPFVTGQAAHCASLAVRSAPREPAARIRWLFERALGRAPEPAETSRWLGLVADLAREHGVAPGDVPASEPVWKDVAHTLFNAKEFINIR